MQNQQQPEIPVYLFTGFLESGKTKFIQESLEDPKFNTGERTLLLLCEEGEEEYDPSRFAAKNVYIYTVEDVQDLTPDRLSAQLKRAQAERVIVEYNGMWQLNALYSALPESWLIYQQLLFVDASTFETYNANMRSLMVDKLNTCQLVAFNRMKPDADITPFHQAVRAVSRRTDIVYEYTDGKIQYDEIEDPLPFDLDAPVVRIEDQDYAIWFRDLMDDMEKYDGKTVSYLGVVAADPKLTAQKTIIVGRHVMTCCVQDIQYSGLACVTDNAAAYQSYDWVKVTGTIKLERSKVYRSRGPVLHVTSIERAAKPEKEVATFY